MTEMTEKHGKTVAQSHSNVGKGPGNKPVGIIGIVLIMAYLILFSIFLLYGIVQLWPHPSSTEGLGSPVTFLTWTFSISDETRLLFIVAMAGALGGLVHGLRSFYCYVGYRRVIWSWSVMYVLLPFIGTTLALVFYLVIRGGFFSPQATVQQTSPFGFAALAGLVGMFSEQAVEKLRRIAETLLAKVPPGEDNIGTNAEKQ